MGETLKEQLDRLNKHSKTGAVCDLENFAFTLIGAYRTGDLIHRDEITPAMAAEVLADDPHALATLAEHLFDDMHETEEVTLENVLIVEADMEAVRLALTAIKETDNDKV